MMKLLLTAALTVTTLVSPGWTGSAKAWPNPTGTLCGLVAASDPQISGTTSGVLFGGPLVFSDDSNGTVSYTGRIICSVHVNAPTHAGASSGNVGGVQSRASVAAGTVSYASDNDDNLYVCTRAEISSPRVTLYWNDSHDPLVEGTWSTDPSSRCAFVLSASSPGEDETPHQELDELVRLVNSVICPLLAIVFPPEGDVGILWDCPPYTRPRPYAVGVVDFHFMIPVVAATA